MNRRRRDPSQRPRIRWRQGMVLVLVLIVVAMLSLAGFSFNELMFIEHKGARLAGRQLQVRSIVESGSEAILAYLDQPDELKETLGGHSDNPQEWQAVSVSAERVSGGGTFSVIAPPATDDESTTPRFGLSDESSRLNLTALLAWDAHEPGRGRETLMQLPGMTIELADALLDWIDADDEPRESGAESEFYERIEFAASPTNAVPTTLEELLLVRGVTRQHLFGADVNRNGQIETSESTAIASSYRSSLPADSRGWEAYLSLTSAESNRDQFGQPRINLNGLDLSELHRALASEFDRKLADFVIQFRQYGPVPPGSGGPTKSGVAVDLSQAAAFTLQSPWDLIGATISVPAKEAAVLVKSPLVDNREAMRQYLPRFLDRLTVTDVQIIVGRVNVNEAPSEVLAGIPGLETDQVDGILSKRQPTAAGDPLARHAAWLVLDDILDLKSMRSLWPYVTGGGDVYRAQIVGSLDESQWMERVEIIASATRRPSRLLSWKDLRPLGIGFDPELLAGPTLDSRR